MITCIQNKFFYICFCTVYIYYVYINTNIYKFCLYIKYHIWYKLWEYKYVHVNIFKIYTVYVCIYIYIINIHSTHTYIMQTKTCILDVINRDLSFDSTNIIVCYY